MPATLESLALELATVKEQLDRVLASLSGIGAGSGAETPGAAPLSASALADRWNIHAPNESLRWKYLARQCRDRGLRPLSGRGKTALYCLPDVLRAEQPQTLRRTYRRR